MIPLIGIQYDEVDGFWPHIKPFIEEAMVKGGSIEAYDPEYVFDRLKSMDMQCWIGYEDGAIQVVYITQISVLPKMKLLMITHCGAVHHTIDKWLDHLDVFKAYASENDCELVRIPGRQGWMKALKPDRIRVELDFEVKHENLH